MTDTYQEVPMPQGIYPHKSRPVAERFWEKVDKSSECWTWTASLRDTGYGQFNALCPDGKRRPLKAHRVAWELTNGPIPVGLNVLHKCDNPPCVRPDHLFLGTHADNTADMIRKGRQHDGSNNQRGDAHYLRRDPQKARESAARMRERGRKIRGAEHHAAKLSEGDVRSIRHLYAAGRNQYLLAAAYGLSQGTISSIVRRKIWKHVA